MSIRVAILGYGNLGRGMECAVKQNDDMELVAVFTRRDPATVKTLTDVFLFFNINSHTAASSTKPSLYPNCKISLGDPVAAPSAPCIFNISCNAFHASSNVKLNCPITPVL